MAIIKNQKIDLKVEFAPKVGWLWQGDLDYEGLLSSAILGQFPSTYSFFQSRFSGHFRLSDASNFGAISHLVAKPIP